MNKPLTRAEWLEYLDTTWKKSLHEAWDKEWNEMKEDDDTMCYRSELEAAVKAEREACAKVLDEMAARDKLSNYYAIAAKAIRARSQDPMPLFDDWPGGFK